ncbi:MAG TPA: efflux RND transporter periplasmic adaptor subunit [Candidatus Binataceae bacterium]|nr:efflux RND transporter periplasmic adaptor subunit [Candidatus Binataceae bacterium]
MGAALTVLVLAAVPIGPIAIAQETSPTVARLVRQNGDEVMEIAPGAVPGMKIVAVQDAALPGVLETTGHVAFDDRRVATIVSRVQGRIEQTRVSLWDSVRRGEKILALYSPDFMTAEAEYLQAREAIPSGPTGSEFLAGLLTAAKRKLELLGMDDRDIDSLKTPDPTVWIRAPIGGIAVDNKAVRGAAVNPGDVLYSLGTLGEVWITADIFEDELSRVNVGQQLEAVTTAYPAEVFRGEITRISPGIDVNTHTAQVRCEVKNPEGKLKPQMLARVKIITQPGRAIIVPRDALVFDADSYYAFVEASPGIFAHRRVAIGPWNDATFGRVVAGLKAGDRVVTGETLQVNALWYRAHGEGS